MTDEFKTVPANIRVWLLKAANSLSMRDILSLRREITELLSIKKRRRFQGPVTLAHANSVLGLMVENEANAFTVKEISQRLVLSVGSVRRALALLTGDGKVEKLTAPYPVRYILSCQSES